MLCRSCGTEIADKAIVCYRCGVGTTDPVRKPVPIKPAAAVWPRVVAVTQLLVALCLFLAADSTGHPQAMTTAAEVIAALGALLLIIRLPRRR